MLKLDGGNDGLNTAVPYNDPLYRQLRPRLALARSGLLPLSDDLALHPALQATRRLYEDSELALVQDVGHARPDLSHFVSGAIWDSADPARGLSASTGWWGEVAMRNRESFAEANLDAAAVTFESRAPFAAGHGVPVLYARQDVNELFEPPTPLRAPVARTVSAAGAALVQIAAEGDQVRERVARRLRSAPRPTWRPYEEPIDIQVELADWLLGHQVAAPLLRLTLGGFDTHSELLTRHETLLATLDRTLAGLRERLRAAGLWDDTVVLVYSEFGRRPAENGHGGTDHGSSGPVLLAGGRVQGGLYGTRAPLDRLDGDGNPVATTDFRRIYASVVSGLFGLPVDPFAQSGHAPLPLRLA